MCTVSWLPCPDGYTLCFNRDERHTRGRRDPARGDQTDGVRYLAPLDGDFGGYLARGKRVRTHPGAPQPVSGPRIPATPEPQSRGLLILTLIGYGRATEALTALEEGDLAPVQPFSLVALEAGQPARLAAWDGEALTTSPTAPQDSF